MYEFFDIIPCDFIFSNKKSYKSFANPDFMNTFATANEKFSLGM